MSFQELNSIQFISLREVRQHNKSKNSWIIIKGLVYDISNFDHPGGNDEVAPFYGENGTDAFIDAGHGRAELREMENMIIGQIEPDDHDSLSRTIHDSLSRTIHDSSESDENSMQAKVPADVMFAFFAVGLASIACIVTQCVFIIKYTDEIWSHKQLHYWFGKCYKL